MEDAETILATRGKSMIWSAFMKYFGMSAILRLITTVKKTDTLEREKVTSIQQKTGAVILLRFQIVFVFQTLAQGASPASDMQSDQSDTKKAKGARFRDFKAFLFTTGNSVH